MRIATRQLEELMPGPAAEASRKGALKEVLTRADKLSSEKRKAIAKQGANARWKKKHAVAEWPGSRIAD
jgi:hypothetical protein